MTLAANSEVGEVGDTTAPQPTAAPTPLKQVLVRRVGVVFALALIFAISLFLYTRNNDAPSWYHPDEEGKAAQVMSGQFRNFKHPLLLLEASELMTRVRHPEVRIPRGLPTQYRDFAPYPASGAFKNVETVVRDGRLVSAVFGAGTATGLAAAGYLAFGWSGLLIGALVMALCPQLLLYAHDMKEDSALVCGVGMVVFASALFWARPGLRWRIWTLPLLGAAAAIAPSGKYVGIVSLACALPALLLAPPFSWWRTLIVRPVVFAAMFVLVLALINHRALDCWDGFKMGLTQETDHALTGHNDLTMTKPNGFALSSAWHQVPLHIWALSVLLIPATLIQWRRIGLGPWWRRNGWLAIVLLFAILWAVALSQNTIPFHRYALPIVCLVYFLAALGAAATMQFLANKSRAAAAVWVTAVIAVTALVQLPVCLDFNHQYADDSRQHLKNWLNEHASRGAIVAGDRYAQLYSPPDPRIPNARPLGVRTIPIDQVGRAWYVFGAGSLIDDLRRAGVRYVAISEPSYDRYLTPYTHGTRDGASDFERRRKFYTTLLHDWTPVWESQQKYPNGSFVNPKIRLYDLSQKPPTQQRPPAVRSSS